MAQAKVNDFFTAKKRNATSHAAKRRKVEIPFTESVKSHRTRSRSDDGKKSPATNPLVPSDTDSEQESDCFPKLGTMSMITGQSDNPQNEATLSTTDSGKKCGRQRKQANLWTNSGVKGDRRGKVTHSKARLVSKGQTKLTDMVKQTSSPSSQSQSDCGEDGIMKSQEVCDSDSNPPKSAGFITETVIVEEVTSLWDNHSESDFGTPRKRIISDAEPEGPQTRRRKIPVRKLGSNETSESLEHRPESVKKDLFPDSQAGSSKCADFSGDEADREVDCVMTKKSDLLALVAEVLAPPVHAVSPLPTTPERNVESSPSPEPVILTPKLQNLSQKLKSLSQMNGQALKNRLRQSGKLSDVKEKLGELDRSLKETKIVEEVHGAAITEDDDTEPTEKVLPAHQRFAHLAEEGIPSLTLPFTYKLLEGAFQAMDTVVSMLHNRSEMCTFSKLRAAVQNMTKKNFEEKTVGQIKTIVPDAYTFRQEKNIPTFGKKSSGYQLTVEANLEDEDPKNSKETSCQTKEGKPMFKAAALLKRKKCFTSSLLEYLKQHHKTFLASLNPPLSVADGKITRWHPKFQLDKVPEVTPSPLPQPPEVKVYHTAKDVLEKQRGRLNPRVEEALSKVVAEKEKQSIKSESNSSQNLSSTPSLSQFSSASSQSSSSSSSSDLSASSLKGIPPALLAKIRAKEAKKMEEAMTRNPAEDSKTKMMSQLPDMIRILRTYFITEKKPAIPLEAVYKKLEDSFRTGISQRDLEQHINLLKELAPELISVVEIRRGKYLKLDKNVDVQAVSSRILNLVKSRK